MSATMTEQHGYMPSSYPNNGDSNHHHSHRQHHHHHHSNYNNHTTTTSHPAEHDDPSVASRASLSGPRPLPVPPSPSSYPPPPSYPPSGPMADDGQAYYARSSSPMPPPPPPHGQHGAAAAAYRPGVRSRSSSVRSFGSHGPRGDVPSRTNSPMPRPPPPAHAPPPPHQHAYHPSAPTAQRPAPNTTATAAAAPPPAQRAHWEISNAQPYENSAASAMPPFRPTMPMPEPARPPSSFVRIEKWLDQTEISAEGDPEPLLSPTIEEHPHAEETSYDHAHANAPRPRMEAPRPSMDQSGRPSFDRSRSPYQYEGRADEYGTSPPSHGPAAAAAAQGQPPPNPGMHLPAMAPPPIQTHNLS
ncbi:hypothetical protein SYNPS1DRAFT_26995, partial [Syncephalis pseudoplumigaleata]